MDQTPTRTTGHGSSDLGGNVSSSKMRERALRTRSLHCIASFSLCSTNSWDSSLKTCSSRSFSNSNFTVVNSLSTWKPAFFIKCSHLSHLFWLSLHTCSNPLALGRHGWLAEATSRLNRGLNVIVQESRFKVQSLELNCAQLFRKPSHFSTWATSYI